MPIVGLPTAISPRSRGSIAAFLRIGADSAIWALLPASALLAAGPHSGVLP